jgi:uncharacterized membrane protein
LTNFYLGLARGPIDHQSSSVINVIANAAISMGSAVVVAAAASAELLPRVIENPGAAVTEDVYGIAVGGDTDGVYGTGVTGIGDPTTLATASAGQGVVVVTQGRCLARVESTLAIAIGDPLGSSNGGAGLLEKAVGTSKVIARALQPVAATPGFHIIAVDVQREGIF